MDNDIAVNINLYNLEDVKFEGSKYVLTSPRSLEACSRLSVKPVELLYRPLSEFQEELLPQDVPLRTIYTVFDESEQIRQKKLKLCREERSRIIQEEKKNAAKSSLRSRLATMPSQDAAENKSKDVKKGSPKAGVTFKTGIKGKPLYRSIDKESPKLHRELLSKKDRNPPRTKSSYAKARPKSAGSRPLQRCSPSVLRGSKVTYRCTSAPNVSLTIPARDKKILQLMKERRESELDSLNTSEQAHQLWEDQKKREEALRTIMENKRRTLLAEENRIKDMRKLKEKQRRAKDEEEERELLRLKIQGSDLKSDLALMNQLRMRELCLSDKIEKEKAKKRIQATNLKAQERDQEEMKEFLLSKQAASLNTASAKREARIHQDSMKKFLDNRQEREQFEQRHLQIKNLEKQNEDQVRDSMELRLSQAEANLSQVLESRNKQLVEHHHEEQAKHERARSSQRKMEEEMEAWRSNLVQHKKLLEDRAMEVVNQSVEMRAFQARKNRLAKEVGQKKNLTKLQREDDKWRRQLERSLIVKDRKVNDLIEEKDRSIAQTRAMARLSETLRDDLREKYVSDTFDKKALEAQLYSNLYSNHRSRSPAALKNRSSIKIC
ncbi:coiled-coil domain-containing protein 177-like isoform x4 [Plakobranchus ocellatus]|uniref:Coiled-coil domain-containing protein 177-like isoform x4 n=1 Tax=Plakobranchus ocellatus TaxID=259542 RepID=A0AAV4CK68_9GAST|nr:coiled-coil domain-containing protein 177-like isoform x4 [Plakobranchus ocellatus]